MTDFLTYKAKKSPLLWPEYDHSCSVCLSEDLHYISCSRDLKSTLYLPTNAMDHNILSWGSIYWLWQPHRKVLSQSRPTLLCSCTLSTQSFCAVIPWTCTLPNPFLQLYPLLVLCPILLCSSTLYLYSLQSLCTVVQIYPLLVAHLLVYRCTLH